MRRPAFSNTRSRKPLRLVKRADRDAVVAIDGPLDVETAEVLREIVGLACENGGNGVVVEVDLRDAERVTTHGADALRECARLGEVHGCQVHVRARRQR